MPALHRRHTAVVTKAYLNSDGSGGGQGGASTSQLKVVVVGASPSGLAAAVGLAQQAGCVVEVHDSRTDPRADKHAENSSTLVALGKHILIRQCPFLLLNALLQHTMHGNDCKVCSTSQGAGHLRPGHSLAPFTETTAPSNQLLASSHEWEGAFFALPTPPQRVPLFAMHLTN